MCTSIIEIARAEGMAKRGDEWFPLSQAVVAYDHARHAPLGDVITLDFIVARSGGVRGEYRDIPDAPLPAKANLQGDFDEMQGEPDIVAS